MRTGKTMRKKLIILAIALLLLGSVSDTHAQVFMIDDEAFDNRLGNNLDGGFIMPDIMPDHDTTWDYTPIGDGLWALGCLGLGYLMRKKRKQNDNQ